MNPQTHKSKLSGLIQTFTTVAVRTQVSQQHLRTTILLANHHQSSYNTTDQLSWYKMPHFPAPCQLISFFILMNFWKGIRSFDKVLKLFKTPHVVLLSQMTQKLWSVLLPEQKHHDGFNIFLLMLWPAVPLWMLVMLMVKVELSGMSRWPICRCSSPSAGSLVRAGRFIEK